MCQLTIIDLHNTEINLNRLCRMGAYYTNQLTISHNFPLKVGVHVMQVCILQSNIYGNGLNSPQRVRVS